MKVAVFGLGQMGLPVAVQLLGWADPLHVFDPDPARGAAADAKGLDRVSGVAEAADAPLVLTALPSDDALRQLCERPDGLLARIPPGGVHLCLGTIGVALADGLAAAHAAAGQGFIACPVFGRPDEAWAADLTAVYAIAGAGSAEVLAAARGAIERFAPRRHEVASPAAACAVKLAGNQMIASAIATMSESFGLARAWGVPPALMHEVVTGKLFRGPVYEGVGRRVAAAFAPDAAQADASAAAAPADVFTMQLGLKDLRLGHAAADAAGWPMPVADAVRGRFAGAAAAGHAQAEWSTLPACIADASNAGLSPAEPSTAVPDLP